MVGLGHGAWGIGVNNQGKRNVRQGFKPLPQS